MTKTQKWILGIVVVAAIYIIFFRNQTMASPLINPEPQPNPTGGPTGGSGMGQPF